MKKLREIFEYVVWIVKGCPPPLPLQEYRKRALEKWRMDDEK